MRPIDADVLVANLEDDVAHMEDDLAIMFTQAAINDIKHAETIDVKPVRHGHWIYTPTNLLGYVCSECGNGMCRFNYCPHCGALMDEVTQ